MEAAALKLELAGKHIKLTLVGTNVWTGEMVPPIPAIELVYLGKGANKMVFWVKKANWVLCVQHNLTVSVVAIRKDFNEEVSTLVRLGTNGVRVPKPFPASPPSPDFLFGMICTKDEGEAGDYIEDKPVIAFIIQYMPSSLYIEMPKAVHQDKLDFAKNYIVTGDRVPTTIETTKSDLAWIRTEWLRERWGDFQVMYNKINGELTVFDPQLQDGMPHNHEAAINKWLIDIDGAIARGPSSRALQSAALKLITDRIRVVGKLPIVPPPTPKK